MKIKIKKKQTEKLNRSKNDHKIREINTLGREKSCGEQEKIRMMITKMIVAVRDKE